MPSPVVEMMGWTKRPVTCRVPVVMSRIAAAAAIRTSDWLRFDILAMMACNLLRRNRSIEAAVNQPHRSVASHYDDLLAERYTWMMGGAAACYSNGKALLDATGIVSNPGDLALDLGAGGGYHSRLLAERGFEVIAVDGNALLLHELAEFCAGFGVAPVQADLLDDTAYRRRAPFALILCVGDTLA